MKTAIIYSLALGSCSVNASDAVDDMDSHVDGMAACIMCVSTPENTSGTRLKIHDQITTSTDGMKLVIHKEIYDTKFNVPCRPGPTSDGVMRCVPDAHDSYSYSDSKCTIPSVTINLEGPCTARYNFGAKITRTATCGLPERHYFKLGTDTKSTTSYFLSAGICRSQTIPSTTLVLLDSEIPDADFAEVAINDRF